MPNTKSGLINVITGEIVGAVDGKMLDLCQGDSPPDVGQVRGIHSQTPRRRLVLFRGV